MKKRKGVSKEWFDKNCPNLSKKMEERSKGPLRSYYGGLIKSRNPMMQFILLDKENKTPSEYLELKKTILDKHKERQFIQVGLN